MAVTIVSNRRKNELSIFVLAHVDSKTIVRFHSLISRTIRKSTHKIPLHFSKMNLSLKKQEHKTKDERRRMKRNWKSKRSFIIVDHWKITLKNHWLNAQVNSEAKKREEFDVFSSLSVLSVDSFTHNRKKDSFLFLYAFWVLFLSTTNA